LGVVGPLAAAEPIGREREQARLQAAVQHAAEGHAAGLLLVGEAGIGKTSLLRWTCRRAVEQGFATLQTVGIEGGVPAPYAGLEELVLSFPAGVVESLDESGVLLGVLAGTVDASAARVAAAFLDVVTRYAEQQAVLVVVDDGQWVDESTAGAIATLARRAEIDRVAVVVSSRATLGWWAPTGLPSIELTGLDEASAVALLRSISDVSEAHARDCWRATAGNPLALIELGPAWSSSSGTTHLQIPDRLERAIDDRLAGVGRASAVAMLAVALEMSGDARRVHAIAEHGAIDRTLAAGLLERAGDVVRFTHPLVRARVIARATQSDLRAMHLRLAAAAAAVGDQETALWHRAEATTEPDEELAEQLSELGDICRRRGATREWLLAAQRAARISPDIDDAAFRLADATHAAWFLGDHDQVERLCGEVRRMASSARVRGRVALAYGQEVTWRDGPLAGFQFLAAEAEAIAAEIPAQAAICAAFAAGAATLALRADLALGAAQRATELAATSDDLSARVVAQSALGSAHLLVGDTAAADALLGPAEQLAVAATEAGMTEAEGIVAQACLANGYAERWDRAIELAGGMLRRGRKAGALELVAQANTTLAELAMRSGRWSEAYGLIRTTIDDPDWGVPGERAWVHAAHARVCAAMGRDEECRTAAAAALEIALPIGFIVAEVWARSALGLLELGASRPEAALVHLDRVQSVYDASGIVEPGTLWWQGDQLDALLATKNEARAKERLAEVDAAAERTGRRYARAAAARGRAQLVDDHLAEGFFAEAIEWATALGSPFELGRTHLARARHRSRVGLPGADEDAGRAEALFEALGATSWLAQVGSRSSPAAVLAVDQLTQSELRVAMAVARGLTNRQAAVELYLSTKTVDFYLQSIYRKLGVRTRTEMSHRLLGSGN
jgi:DNA-binding CsgD family transcriptional regulator